MPEVQKHITSLSKPLAIHPIQVHSCRSQELSLQSAPLAAGLSFKEGRSKIFQTGNKTTVELPAQICRWSKEDPTDSKEMDKVGMDSSFTALFAGGIGGKSPAEQKSLKKIYK